MLFIYIIYFGVISGTTSSYTVSLPPIPLNDLNMEDEITRRRECADAVGEYLSLITSDRNVVVLRAVRGRDAMLPCGQGKVFLDGPNSYIIWLKNDRDILYRYPNENTERRLINHDLYNTACDEEVCHDDTSLLLKKVEDKDGGIYRCRVHYQASPSVDYVIDMRLVDSPGIPRMYSGDGKEISKGYIGPLSLGSDLTLICEVNDASFLNQPDTMLYWKRNSVILYPEPTKQTRVLRTEMHLRQITRDEQHARYECLVHSADVTAPLAASVVIEMFLPPLSVEIRLNNNNDFEAGQPRVVDCVVVGCMPPPVITWHIGENELRLNGHKEVRDGNYTVSSLTWTPSLGDNLEDLICRAQNSHIPAVIFEDKIQVNVGYRPICLNPKNEPIRVKFAAAKSVTCIVEASPEPLQFIWTFEDSRTYYTTAMKVAGHKHRYTSTLNWHFQQRDLGILLCRAANVLGEQKRPCSFAVTYGADNDEDLELTKAHWTRLMIGAGAACVSIILTMFCVWVVKIRRDSNSLNPDLIPNSDDLELRSYGMREWTRRTETEEDCSFHREPDFAREERLLGSTNITVNQLASCGNQHPLSAVPNCRVLVESNPGSPEPPSTTKSYYV